MKYVINVIVTTYEITESRVAPVGPGRPRSARHRTIGHLITVLKGRGREENKGGGGGA